MPSSSLSSLPQIPRTYPQRLGDQEYEHLWAILTLISKSSSNFILYHMFKLYIINHILQVKTT